MTEQMSSRLSVIVYIILCFQVGIILTVLPWVQHGWLGGALSDWGNNYFLLFASHKMGYGLQRVISSGWVRGAVSGLGMLNILMGAWELMHFREAVQMLDATQDRAKTGTTVKSTVIDETRSVKTDPLSDYPRRNH